MSAHESALRADFQRFYGLNLDGLGDEYTVEHAGALFEHLPKESATVKEIDPSQEWGPVEYLLARIEYDLRCLAYGGKGPRPKPMKTPADCAKRKAHGPKASKHEMSKVADALGIPEERRLGWQEE